MFPYSGGCGATYVMTLETARECRLVKAEILKPALPLLLRIRRKLGVWLGITGSVLASLTSR